MRRAFVLAVLAAALAIAVAGCGGGGGDGTTEAATTTSTTGATSGDAAAGKEVFASAGCGGCHTLSAAGSSGSVGPNLDDASPSYDHVVTQVTNGGGAMPSFKNDLTEQQIQDVAAFVSGS
ncbi:MAG: c-type cytochrome [Gaiella sp.]|uniref:c-type cytochrome n=1 Tax=Gaiella sp. TaxID=2663207 RepID=UPI003C73E79A